MDLYLSNTVPYGAELFVCSETSVHLCPTQQGEVASQVIINITVHLLRGEIESHESFFYISNNVFTKYSPNNALTYYQGSFIVTVQHRFAERMQ